MGGDNCIWLHATQIAASQPCQAAINQPPQPQRAALAIAPFIGQLVQPGTAAQNPQIAAQKGAPQKMWEKVEHISMHNLHLRIITQHLLKGLRCQSVA